ncbi:FecR domain-containing protein [Hallella mizrahii]|uniref:DUF4974 domain-containing protein n=1 Tax=Hallella mizrahii TaxID=2606637 RepID=A0A7K0KHY9_9BACT|nr:FecR domain-containing protein [Hallella mizrahii]MST85563.1 DUF4974 domain-containing protein [Hallella mizrahii]
MNKIEHLIAMMEKPDRYSQEEWRQVLSDKDCREYYRLMCDTSAALHDHRPDETETEEALQRFEKRYMSDRRHIALWRQLAAVFVGLMLISGLAFAAITMVRHHQQAPKRELAVAPTKAKATAKTTTAVRDTIKSQPQEADGMKQFINTPIANIVNEIASYYGLKAEIRNTQTASIRLYFNWNRQCSAAQVVSQLNQFDNIRITLDGSSLVLE